jgi:FAD-linked sulfhydryl oxidase
MISRFIKLFFLVLALVTIPTLYLLYPSSHVPPPSPGDPVYEYEAGGIDSEHWREKIKPDFEVEEARSGVEDEAGRGFEDDSGAWLGGGILGGGRVDEEVISGGVIMPKLENATAK